MRASQAPLSDMDPDLLCGFEGFLIGFCQQVHAQFASLITFELGECQPPRPFFLFFLRGRDWTLCHSWMLKSWEEFHRRSALLITVIRFCSVLRKTKCVIIFSAKHVSNRLTSFQLLNYHEDVEIHNVEVVNSEVIWQLLTKEKVTFQRR